MGATLGARQRQVSLEQLGWLLQVTSYKLQVTSYTATTAAATAATATIEYYYVNSLGVGICSAHYQLIVYIFSTGASPFRGVTRCKRCERLPETLSSVVLQLMTWLQSIVC